MHQQPTDFQLAFPRVQMAWLPHPKPLDQKEYIQGFHQFQANHMTEGQRGLFISRKGAYQAAVLMESGKSGWRMTYGLAEKFHPPVSATDDGVALNLMQQYSEKPHTLALTGERKVIRSLFEKIHLHNTMIHALWEGRATMNEWLPKTYDPFNL